MCLLSATPEYGGTRYSRTADGRLAKSRSISHKRYPVTSSSARSFYILPARHVRGHNGAYERGYEDLPPPRQLVMAQNSYPVRSNLPLDLQRGPFYGGGGDIGRRYDPDGRSSYGMEYEGSRSSHASGRGLLAGGGGGGGGGGYQDGSYDGGYGGGGRMGGLPGSPVSYRSENAPSDLDGGRYSGGRYGDTMGTGSGMRGNMGGGMGGGGHGMGRGAMGPSMGTQWQGMGVGGGTNGPWNPSRPGY